MKSTYEIRHFKNSGDPELIKALALYSQNIEPALRTDSREIMYWIDKYNKSFEDSFFILGFYLNGVLIGFSEIAYFIKERIIIADYLVIEKQFRKNNTFYEFVQKIEEFLLSKNLSVDYVVVEIGYYNEELEPPEKSKHMIRLLKMAGFSVVKCNYYTPSLGINNYESQMKSVLMLYSLDGTKKIRKDTFLQIVHAIYFKYNQRWYNAFLDEDQKIEYQKGLNRLLSKIEKDISKKEFIEINGYGGLFSQLPPDSGIFERHKLLKIITGILLFIVCFVLVTAIYLFLKLRFGIDEAALGPIFYTTLFLMIFLFAIIFEKKSNVFSKIIEKIFDIW